MSDQPTSDNTDREIVGLDEHLDEAQQDARIGSDETDDLPITPPDMQPRNTEREMAGWAEGEETIDERIAQEVPEEGTAYGAPDNESGLDREPRVGGDDPLSIPAEDDFVSDSAADERHVSQDDPAEEAAMHVEGDEPLDDTV
ncbi:adenosine deaminase [Janibacter melonis]|uniref:adenosine deaminase n=1 Tax=Janibacter melonis TaxID=262209 RepID=UPI001F28556D|nr:adenosine deaminase [Janibacter melonis]